MATQSQHVTTEPTAVPAISDGERYVLQAQAPVWVHLGAAAPLRNVENKFWMSRWDILIVQAEAGEMVYVWTQRDTGTIVFEDEA